MSEQQFEAEKESVIMDAYALHLAVAALVGASVVAVSAYYMQRRTLIQLLEYTKTVDKDREKDGVPGGGSPRHLKKRRPHARRKGSGYYRQSTLSLPDVTAVSGGMDGEEKRNGSMAVDGIPDGLPSLRTHHEGMALSESSSEVMAMALISDFYFIE